MPEKQIEWKFQKLNIKEILKQKKKKSYFSSNK